MRFNIPGIVALNITGYFNFKLNSQPWTFHYNSPPGTPLECYTCYSTKSWEDCMKHQRIEDCSELNKSGSLKVCAKTTYTQRLDNGQETIQFGKSCSLPCSESDCNAPPAKNKAATGVWCEVECCKVTLCNTGTTKTFSEAQHRQFSGVVLVLCFLSVLVVVNFGWIGKTDRFLSRTFFMRKQAKKANFIVIRGYETVLFLRRCEAKS